MKKTKILLTLLISLVYASGVLAQSSFVGSGKSENSANGSISYSVGQTFYNSVESQNGSIENGVQHAYIINANPTDINDNNISLNVKAYPNPTTDYLNLSVSAFENYSELSFSLFDLSGHLLKRKRLVQSETRIDFSMYSSGTYILNVKAKGILRKSFKIIKR